MTPVAVDPMEFPWVLAISKRCAVVLTLEVGWKQPGGRQKSHGSGCRERVELLLVKARSYLSLLSSCTLVATYGPWSVQLGFGHFANHSVTVFFVE